jgi:DNA invertase Pin-like site-specific DNA recombinase
VLGVRAPSIRLIGEYVDHESGRKGINGRKQFNQVFEDASPRKFDIVLFWALDRFSREGMVPTINYLQRLDSYGVAFHSYTEGHLATDNKLVRNILAFAIVLQLASRDRDTSLAVRRGTGGPPLQQRVPQ